MGRIAIALLGKLKSEIRFALASFGGVCAAILLAIGAFGFLLAACFIRLSEEMSASAAASVMAGALALLSVVIIVTIIAVKRSRERRILQADQLEKKNGSDTALDDIVEWLERSGFPKEAVTMRATLALSRQAKPYHLVAISFLFGLVSSIRFK